MFKNFISRRIWWVGAGMIIFILVAVFGNHLPVQLTPKLPNEIRNAIQYVGLSEGELLSAIRKYLPNQKQKDQLQSDIHKVTRVIDGDTVEIDGVTTVRYIGINAPEKYSKITKAECWNEEAIRKNSELVLGKNIRLEKDVSETDKYGRLLRYVFVEDIFVNEELARSGSAYAKTYPPDLRERERLLDAEIQAKAAGAGLWGACQ